MTGWYILDAHRNPVKVEIDHYARWEKAVGREGRIVKVDQVRDCRVSTVFLGLDHGYLSDRPVLFETLVFGPDESEMDGRRYHTWQEAEEGHAELVKIAEAYPPYIHLFRRIESMGLNEVFDEIESRGWAWTLRKTRNTPGEREEERGAYIARVWVVHEHGAVGYLGIDYGASPLEAVRAALKCAIESFEPAPTP